MPLYLRPLQLKDLPDYLRWKHPSREFHQYNGPYFRQDTVEDLNKLIATYRSKLEQGEKEVMPDKKIIADQLTDEIIGEVNWYWKSEETLWAVYRKARIVDGQYYDSVSYGILREEWEDIP